MSKIESLQRMFFRAGRDGGGASATAHGHLFFPAPDPIAAFPVETKGKFVPRELTAEQFVRAQNYFKMRCVETEQRADSADEYWQTICPLMQRVNRLLSNTQCDLAVVEMKLVKSTVEQRISALKTDTDLDEKSRLATLKNQTAILSSIKFDLLILDPPFFTSSH